MLKLASGIKAIFQVAIWQLNNYPKPEFLIFWQANVFLLIESKSNSAMLKKTHQSS